MKSDSPLTWVGVIATIIATIIAVLTYCSPPAAPSSAPKVTLPVTKPVSRPAQLPIQHEWQNASGPVTFSVLSSAGVIETGKYGTALHVRFAVRNGSTVPVSIWARSATSRRQGSIEGWTVDAGSTVCSPEADQFTIIPVGDPSEDLIKERESGRVIEWAPTVAPGGVLLFTARFECGEQIKQDAILFATIRLIFAHGRARRTVYFQNSALPIFLGKGMMPAL